MARTHLPVAAATIALVGLMACGGSTTTSDPGPGGDAVLDGHVFPEVLNPDYGGDVPTQVDGDLVSPPDPGADGTPGDTPSTGQEVAPGGDVVGGCATCAYGSLKGLTCAPNQTTAIPSVKVWVDALDCGGNPLHIETYSDAKGQYQMDGVPCGLETIHQEKGSFKHDFAVFVDAGLVVDVTSAVGDRCFKANSAKIAVITGDWDMIEGLLDQLKLKYTLYEGGHDGWGSGSGSAQQAVGLLTDSTELNKYDVLFIDCGATPEPVMDGYGSEISPNLKAFVAKGGSIYASDYAFRYFSDTWPGYVNFPSDPYVVNGNQTVDGHIIDPPLYAYLGNLEWVKVKYGLGPLAKASGVGPDTLVHIEAAFKQFGNAVLPTMMSFLPEAGGGRVVYTNFHNDEQAGQIKIDLKNILNFVVFML